MEPNFVVCPFNKNHIISKLRIQYHLVKCKNNYPFSKKLVCPYDATEYIEPSEFTTHLHQCKKKQRLDVSEEYRQKQFELIQHGDISMQTFFANGVEVTDEWNVEPRDKDDDRDENLTRDELRVREFQNKTSKALQKACAFSSLNQHPVGRGKGSDLYRNYIENLYRTPENSACSETINYFPSRELHGNVAEGLIDNVEQESEEEGIYDDAEEDDSTSNCEYKLQGIEVFNLKRKSKWKVQDKASVEVDNPRKGRDGKITSVNTDQKISDFSIKSSDCKFGDNQKVFDLKKQEHGFGRGVSIFGREKHLQETVPKSSLDNIIKNAIHTSKTKLLLDSKDNTTLPLSTHKSTDDLDSCSSNSVVVNEKTNISNAVNTPPQRKPQSYLLNDDMICFRMPPNRAKSSKSGLSDSINTVVNQLSTASLNDNSLQTTLKGGYDHPEKEIDLLQDLDLPMPSFGRGKMLRKISTQ